MNHFIFFNNIDTYMRAHKHITHVVYKFCC